MRNISHNFISNAGLGFKFIPSLFYLRVVLFLLTVVLIISQSVYGSKLTTAEKSPSLLNEKSFNKDRENCRNFFPGYRPGILDYELQNNNQNPLSSTLSQDQSSSNIRYCQNTQSTVYNNP